MILRIVVTLLMAIMLIPSVATARGGMCDSVKSQINKAQLSGGKARATKKVKQMIAAFKYLSGNISTEDLLACIMETGVVDAGTVREEAIEAGIAHSVIDKALGGQPAASSFWQAAEKANSTRVNSTQPKPVENDNTVETEETYVPTETYVDTTTVGMSETQTDLGGGVTEEARCQQISPWTWCAY